MVTTLRARNYLIMVRGAPGMFATSRESLLNIVATVLYLFIDGFWAQDFWKKHLGVYGNEFKTIDDPITTEWVNAVIEDALSQLPS